MLHESLQVSCPRLTALNIFLMVAVEYSIIWVRPIINLPTTQPTRGEAVTAVWQTLCKLYRPLPPPVMGARLPLLAMSRQIQVRLPHTNRSGFAIYATDKYKVRNQISIRCNRIEHWVHLRCAGIRLAQYTDT